MERTRPSGPRKNLLLGSATDLIASPLEFLKDTASYGDVASFRLGPFRAYLVRAAEDVNEVLVKQGDVFTRDPIMRYASGKFLGNGIINSEGNFHRDQRRMMQPAFHHKRLEGYVELMVNQTDRMIKQWESLDDIPVNSEIAALTLKIVCEALFKSDITDDVANVIEAVHYFEEVLAVELRHPVPIPDWLPIPRKQRLRKGVALLHEVISEMIGDRRASAVDKGDVLSTLLLATSEDGSPMPEEQMIDEMTTMVIAGHETSATVITWILYLMGLYPEINTRVVNELDSVLAGRAPQMSDLPQLKYLDCVIKETLRLFPPGWLIGRTPKEDLTIGGYTIKKGQLIYMSPYITQRDSRYFEEPDAFKPDRWLDGFESTLPKGAYFPFSNGFHVCIGQQFALMEIKLIVARLLQHFQFERTQSEPIEPVALVTLCPDKTLHVRAMERVFA